METDKSENHSKNSSGSSFANKMDTSMPFKKRPLRNDNVGALLDKIEETFEEFENYK